MTPLPLTLYVIIPIQLLAAASLFVHPFLENDYGQILLATSTNWLISSLAGYAHGTFFSPLVRVSCRSERV